MVHIPVGHVQLTSLFIDDHVRGTAEVGRLVTATVFALAPDLHEELTLPGELQDLGVALAAASEPYVVAGIDIDAVLELGPLVSRPWTAPRADHVS